MASYNERKLQFRLNGYWLQIGFNKRDRKKKPKKNLLLSYKTKLSDKTAVKGSWTTQLVKVMLKVNQQNP